MAGINYLPELPALLNASMGIGCGGKNYNSQSKRTSIRIRAALPCPPHTFAVSVNFNFWPITTLHWHENNMRAAPSFTAGCKFFNSAGSWQSDDICQMDKKESARGYTLKMTLSNAAEVLILYHYFALAAPLNLDSRLCKSMARRGERERERERLSSDTFSRQFCIYATRAIIGKRQMFVFEIPRHQNGHWTVSQIFRCSAEKTWEHCEPSWLRHRTHTQCVWPGLPGWPFRGQIWQIWPFFDGWPRSFVEVIKYLAFFKVWAYLMVGLFTKSLFSKIQNLAFFSYKLLATLCVSSRYSLPVALHGSIGGHWFKAGENFRLSRVLIDIKYNCHKGSRYKNAQLKRGYFQRIDFVQSSNWNF